MSKAMTRSVLKEVQDFRDCVKRVVAMLSGKQIPVAERGNEAYVRYNRRGEPVLVNIPSIPDDASPTLMNAVRGFLDHEVAHIGVLTDAPRRYYKNYALVKSVEELGPSVVTELSRIILG